jgi:hypothetical protein
VAVKPSTLLRRLESIKDRFDPEAADRKLGLLQQLARRRFPRAREVERLHEALCFLQAYPDGQVLLERVERMLEGFAERSDLRRHRQELVDTGIAGTPIYFSFFWATAQWLVSRWPECLRVDWEEFEHSDELVDILHLLVPYGETPAVDNVKLTAREWVERLKGPSETDGAFVVRRFAAMPTDVYGREATFEGVDIPFRLDPGPDTPSRTRARYRRSPVVFQTRPLSRERPSLRLEVKRPPLAVRAVAPREGQRLIELTREAMVTRSRDLYVFLHADRNDVRLVDCGDGLQFACIGTIPMRRLVLESVYGFLTLKNGVPIGYVLSSSLFSSSEIAYNVFESFRGAEAAVVFGRVLAMVRRLFAADTFSIDPYQLGFGNPEGLQSGAWWFYYKLGFRPRDAEVRRVLRRELQRMQADPRHRSDLDTLDRLASKHMFFWLDRPRDDVLGRVALGKIGLAVSRYVADRFGSDRERGTRTCAKEAASRLGLRSTKGFTSGERLLWERWSPLIMALPGIERWKPEQRRALARIVRAKGGRRESDYVALFNRHRQLRQALLGLAELA